MKQPNLLRTIQSRRNDLQEHRDASLAELDQKRNAIGKEIQLLRNKIESKDEQITASVVKKAEKAEKQQNEQQTEQQAEQQPEQQAEQENEQLTEQQTETAVLDDQAEN